MARFGQENKAGNEFIIPPVVFYEVKRGLVAVNSNRRLWEFENLYRALAGDDLRHAVWEHATRLYAELKIKGKIIGDADLLIAAYCLVNDFTLVTNNTKHFAVIRELPLVNWKN
jgi:tRNA(fMet)-specific endonuclease VapC